MKNILKYIIAAIIIIPVKLYYENKYQQSMSIGMTFMVALVGFITGAGIEAMIKGKKQPTNNQSNNPDINSENKQNQGNQENP